MQYTVSISIAATSTTPALTITGIPWYPGITVLQAMIVAQSLTSYMFRTLHYTLWGALVDSLNGVEDDNGSGNYWFFSVSNNPSVVGVSEAILIESAPGNIDIEWTYGSGSTNAHAKQISVKKGEAVSA